MTIVNNHGPTIIKAFRVLGAIVASLIYLYMLLYLIGMVVSAGSGS